jgi:hypothetical protein
MGMTRALNFFHNFFPVWGLSSPPKSPPCYPTSTPMAEDSLFSCILYSSEGTSVSFLQYATILIPMMPVWFWLFCAITCILTYRLDKQLRK